MSGEGDDMNAVQSQLTELADDVKKMKRPRKETTKDLENISLGQAAVLLTWWTM